MTLLFDNAYREYGFMHSGRFRQIVFTGLMTSGYDSFQLITAMIR